MIFIKNKKELTKNEKILKEWRRLKKIFSGLDEKKKGTVEPLIKTAAFLSVSLDELQDIINAEGYTVEYQNGATQIGTKQSDAVKTHIAMTKNYSTVVKQLLELVPAEQRKESKLEMLRSE